MKSECLSVSSCYSLNDDAFYFLVPQEIVMYLVISGIINRRNMVLIVSIMIMWIIYKILLKKCYGCCLLALSFHDSRLM